MPEPLLDESDETSPLIGSAPASKTKSIVLAVLLIFIAQTVSVGAGIRYGFLAVSFTKRGIEGRVYGFVSGSMFFGYLGGFLCKGVGDYSAKRWSPKAVIVASLLLSAIVMLVSGVASWSSSNTLFIIVSVLARVSFGFICFSCSVCIMDIQRTLFNTKFELVNGLVLMGYFSGHGIGESAGAALYDHYGYFIPFLFGACYFVLTLLLSVLLLPTCPSILLSANDEPDSVEKEKTKSLHWAVGLPLTCTILINCVYSFLQVTVTMYLYDKFNISLSLGGTVLIALTIGVVIGSTISGLMCQSHLMSCYTQMVLGAGLVMLGILLMFPHPSLHWLYNGGLLVAYIAVFIAGVGDPLISVPTLKAMTDIQNGVGKASPAQLNRIAGMWLMGTCCSSYTGQLIGGVFMNYLEFYQGAYILSGMCGVSMFISIFLRYRASIAVW